MFKYFDNLRKIFQLATSEIFVVHPYLDADFISAYAPFVNAGVSLRLLTGTRKRYLDTLLPAAKALSAAQALTIAVRSDESFHARFIFIDRKDCYFSGASFKDGAQNAPTIICQIFDAIQSMWKTYDDLCAKAKTEYA